VPNDAVDTSLWIDAFVAGEADANKLSERRADPSRHPGTLGFNT
jgi:hypothetical protein